MDKVLDLKDVVMKFGGLTALNGLSFDVYKGESLALIGPNGAGKTTIFSLIMGERRQMSGSIRFLGREISGEPVSRRVNRGIARTNQAPRPFFGMSVAENIRIGLMPDSLWHMFRQPGDRENELAIAESVGFSEADLDRYPGELAMGDLRKLELARTLATKPSLLLLDEVFAGLTLAEIAQISGILEKKRAEGVTMVIVSHDLRSLGPLVGRAVAMAQGAVIAEGAFQTVLRDEAVQTAYLGQA